MRTILVPTDLSPAAENALRYAAQLAVEFDATQTLAYIQPLPMDPLRIGEISPEIYEDSERNLEDLAARIRSRGLRVNTLIQLGKPVPRLMRILEDGDFDLVIMGSQGEHYLPQRLVGGTTTHLMEQVTLPILAVPPDFSGGFPQRIMWATDSSIGPDAAFLYPLFALVDRVTTELQVFHYQERGERQLPEERLREVLGEVPHTIYVQLYDGDSVDRALQDFARKTSIDLVAIVHRRIEWLSRLLVSSHTRAAVATLPVPVLILQEQRAL